MQFSKTHRGDSRNGVVFSITLPVKGRILGIYVRVCCMSGGSEVRTRK